MAPEKPLYVVLLTYLLNPTANFADPLVAADKPDLQRVYCRPYVLPLSLIASGEVTVDTIPYGWLGMCLDDMFRKCNRTEYHEPIFRERSMSVGDAIEVTTCDDQTKRLVYAVRDTGWKEIK